VPVEAQRRGDASPKKKKPQNQNGKKKKPNELKKNQIKNKKQRKLSLQDYNDDDY
jgi:hypothetical protein